MSRSHFIFRDVPVDAWVDRYEKVHQDPINRVFHTFGIRMIAVSIPLFLIAPLVRGFSKIPLSLFTAGWICQVLGHTIEGKPPEFLKDWRFLSVGLRRWLRALHPSLLRDFCREKRLSPRRAPKRSLLPLSLAYYIERSD
jgi:Protein of unknown function (DUF962)